MTYDGATTLRVTIRNTLPLGQIISTSLTGDACQLASGQERTDAVGARTNPASNDRLRTSSVS
jgi:hypothetical protein